MRYSKILISLLSISLIGLVHSENKSSKQNEIIVESAETTDRTTIESTSVNNTIEDVTTEISVETTVVQDENDVQEEVEVENHDKTVSRTKLPTVIDDDPDYEKGSFGGYYSIGTGPKNNYFFHGKYQKPSTNYYGNYHHTLEDKSTLGYYLGYGMSKMDHNEYFRHNNYTRFKVHHYFFKNSTMLSEQDVGSDHLLRCAQNTSIFCPENTESICLQNTTVWCASRISAVKPCEVDGSTDCVITRIPCVKSDGPNCNQMVEVVEMPCIAKIKVMDPMEDKNGLTLISVAGTFVLVPVIPIRDRTYCVTIVAEPTRD